MPQEPVAHSLTATLDYERTLVLAIELSNTSWVLAAQIPGLPGVKAKRSIEPTAEALMAAIEGYRARAEKAGRNVDRVVAIYEAGWSGFWLVRWLAKYGIETHVIQPSSVPVDRRARRAKSDGIDAELLLRTLLAWLRGEPRVCSMVPMPTEADEDARRCVREREELVAERVGLVNRIGAVLATLGAARLQPAASGSAPTSRRIADGPRGFIAHRMPTRKSPACSTVWSCADPDHRTRTIARRSARRKTPDKADEMIQQLAKLRGIGVQSATVLVREGSCANSPTARRSGPTRALRPLRYSSGGTEREQGISKAGNRAVADRDGRVGMALAALPAGLCAGELVPRARQRHGSPHAQGDGGGAGTKAADRLVAVRDPGRCPGGRRHEACVLIDPRD